MTNQKLKADKRKILGRKVKNLRVEGLLPANIYGKKLKSQAVQVNIDEFNKVFGISGETGLIDLTLSGKKKPVLIHNVQKDPISDMPIHVDFLQVNLKEKVSAEVPIELVGESSAENQGLGTVVQYLDEVGVEALPTDLPEKFEVSLTELKNVDDSVMIKDLNFDSKKIEIKDDKKQIIVKVEPPREEEEELVVPGVEEGDEEKPEEGTEGDEEKPEEGTEEGERQENEESSKTSEK